MLFMGNVFKCYHFGAAGKTVVLERLQAAAIVPGCYSINSDSFGVILGCVLDPVTQVPDSVPVKLAVSAPGSGASNLTSVRFGCGTVVFIYES